MFFAYVVGAIALALLLFTSGVGKLTTRYPALRERQMEVLINVQVAPRLIPVLGLLEIAGALGLILGIAVPALGIVAGIGVVLYFVGAVVAHLRVGRHDLIGPMVPGIIAVLVLVFRILSA